MNKRTTVSTAGDAEALRIYERMQEEEQRKAQAKKDAAQPQKKVTLPRLKFMDDPK